MRMRFAPIGVPTQTPASGASVAARMPSRVMSVTSRHSVIPYGVCAVAFGITRAAAVRSASLIGAPVERNVSTPASAARSSAVRASAVATTFRIAAGERKTMRACEARTAVATADAVRVRGAETSMSGVTESVPSAGPRRAKGAKPVTRPVPGETSKCAARMSRRADSCRCV